MYEHQEELGTEGPRLGRHRGRDRAALDQGHHATGTVSDHKLWFSDTYVRTPAGWSISSGRRRWRCRERDPRSRFRRARSRAHEPRPAVPPGSSSSPSRRRASTAGPCARCRARSAPTSGTTQLLLPQPRPGSGRVCRCRPEAAPGTPAWLGTSAVVKRALRLTVEPHEHSCRRDDPRPGPASITHRGRRGVP